MTATHIIAYLTLPLLFLNCAYAAEYRAPISTIPSYSNLARCVAFPLQAYQALIYNNGCSQSDLQAAASCLCLKTANMASLTNLMWTAVSSSCKQDATEEFSSGLQVLTEYCAEVRGAGAQTTANQATTTKTSGNHSYYPTRSPVV